ncbi:MAG: hypothetical protein Fur005_15380 [Roseiflexaceae bacterium]
MPIIRKLTNQEVEAIEARDRRRVRGEPRPRVRDEPPPAFDHLPLAQRSKPKVGDIVRYAGTHGEQRGIVTRIAQRGDGWVAAEVLTDDETRWMEAGRIQGVIGRPRGISRIDQPHRRTHGWFVRLYDGSATRIARMFSDQKHAGVGRALMAALQFHANHDTTQKPA